MTPEIIDLLKQWSLGIFIVVITLIWAIENIVTAFANRNRPKHTLKKEDVGDDDYN